MSDRPQTPPRKPPRRADQPVGAHFSTPSKARKPKKDSALVQRPEADRLRQQLADELVALTAPKVPAFLAPPEGYQDGDGDVNMVDVAEPLYAPVPVLTPDEAVDSPTSPLNDSAAQDEKRPRRLIPDDSAQRLYTTWIQLVPTLIPEYLAYIQSAQGRVGGAAAVDAAYHCPNQRCYLQTVNLTCLHFDHLTARDFKFCQCVSLPRILVQRGLFPTAPTQPRIAVSIDLLDFYVALFERSADAITALAGALQSVYQRRGFPMLNDKGEPIQDPFRRSLGYAVQWYDCLKVKAESLLERAVDECIDRTRSHEENGKYGSACTASAGNTEAVPGGSRVHLQDAPGDASVRLSSTGCSEPPEVAYGGHPWTPSPVGQFGPSHAPHDKAPSAPYDLPQDGPPQAGRGAVTELHSRPSVATALHNLHPHELPRLSETPALSSGYCHRILQKRCPACFGGNRFGRSFDREGGDVHVAIDATFGQRHNIAAGDSPWFHEPKYFVSKAKVDAVGERIAEVRKAPPRQRTSRVPDEALDECEKSFEAANEKKTKTHGTKFDDTGLMAMVCRHDIVLFLANVDTPGEQQKFGIALIEELMSLIPKEATVAVFYDIACVLERSLQLYDLLPISIVDRLVFATSVMHAYGHQWACQLVYNPRLRKGLGLTEGEGTERVWSKFRKLIGITRTSGRSRRIWYLDRHADSVNAIARQDLGQWIRSRLKNGVEARTADAEKELNDVAVPVADLQHQWDLQQAAQLSVRNHAPARLKKELDSVLNLQSELEEIEKYLDAVKTNISKDNSNPEAMHFFESLQRSHGRTVDRVESLYASLNVAEDFPELSGLSLDFVRTLLMARDLKINIRKRAIGSFFEWDKLDRAAGGRDQALGTKLHQQTRKAIAKRTPALMTAIRKFNKYCDDLKLLHNKTWKIPLPDHLPTELGALRDDPSLLTDVWITPVSSSIPRWLDDAKVRRGIRAMLLKQRCLEERRRLGDEADNLCRWYGQELTAVELALRTTRYNPIGFLLEQRKAELLLLQARWRTPLASERRFSSNTDAAVRTAQRLSGVASAARFYWVHYNCQDGPDDDASVDLEDGPVDAETVLAHDAIAQLVDEPENEDPEVTDWTHQRPSVDCGFHRQDQSDNPSSSITVPSDALRTSHAHGNLNNTPVLYPRTPDDLPMIVRRLKLATRSPHNQVDDTVVSLSEPRIPITEGDVQEQRTLPEDAEHIRMTLWPNDLARLLNPTGWLNDDCINSCAQVLLRFYGSSHAYSGEATILSSFVMAQQLNGTSTDEAIWRGVYYTRYWDKNVWIVPVHRPSTLHWELAVIYVAERQIAYFDSFGDAASWESVVPDVLRVVDRLVRIAGEHSHTVPALDGRWKSYPLVHQPLQTNNNDCGVWVLACIAAILRGFHAVSIPEHAIAEFRSRLLGLVIEQTIVAG